MRKLAAASALSATLLALAFSRAVAAGPSGNTPAACSLGDDQTLYRLYREAAEKGDAAAQALVGGMFACGENVPRDFAEAAKWYRLAAEQGHPGAQYNLAVLCAGGQGVPQDIGEALKWYRLAAGQGQADAQFELGVMYQTGEGVPRDRVLAYMWLDLAASGFAKDADREMAAQARDQIAAEMTPAEIAEARNQASDHRGKTGTN